MKLVSNKTKEKGKCVMLRKIEMPSNNVDNSVEFVLRGAKKRRSMAMAAARTLTNEQGVKTMLVAIN